MKKSLVYTYLALISLTFFTALISKSTIVPVLVVSLILLLSMLKFLMVAFQFMELKKANPFWKWCLSLVLGMILVLIIFLK
jgi:hypothetical protein